MYLSLTCCTENIIRFNDAGLQFSPFKPANLCAGTQHTELYMAQSELYSVDPETAGRNIRQNPVCRFKGSLVRMKRQVPSRSCSFMLTSDTMVTLNPIMGNTCFCGRTSLH